MADANRNEVVSKRNYWKQEYDKRNSTYEAYKNKYQKYYSLRDKIKAAIINTNSLQGGIKELVNSLSVAVVVGQNKTYGEEDLEKQKENMQEVVRLLQPMVDYCTNKISSLTNSMTEYKKLANNAWNEYSYYNTLLSEIDAEMNSKKVTAKERMQYKKSG